MSRSRGALTAQIPGKRKEMDDFFLHTFNGNNHRHVRGKQLQPHSAHPNTMSSKPKAGEPVLANRVLAGYMAHEFLLKGTLLGQKFDPAQTQALPLAVPGAESKKKPTATATNRHGGPTVEDSTGALPATNQKMKSYAEVASLLKSDGAHIPGIVNPTQLARWIQM